jgi:hypothetical protein
MGRSYFYDPDEEEQALLTLGGGGDTLPDRTIDLPELQITGNPNNDPLEELSLDSPGHADTSYQAPQRLQPSADYEAPDSPMLASRRSSSPRQEARPSVAEPSVDGSGGFDPDNMDFGNLGNGVGWALLADLALNKGKGAGSIMQQGAQVREQKAQLEQRKALQDAQIRQIDARTQNMGTEAELQREQHGIASRNADLRQRELEDGIAARGARAQQVQGQREMQDWEASDQSAQGWEKIAAGERMNDADNAVVGKRGGRARSAGGGGGAGKPRTMLDPETGEEIPILSTDQKRTLDARKGEKKTAALETPFPETEVVDEPGWIASVQTPAARGQIGTLLRGYRQVEDGLAKMEQIRGQKGVEIAGDAAYDAARAQVIGGYTQIGNSGVLNGGEYKRYADLVPSITPSWRDMMPGDNPLERLRGLRNQTASTIDTSLGTYGLRYSRGGGGNRRASSAIADGATPEELQRAGGRRVQ